MVRNNRLLYLSWAVKVLLTTIVLKKIHRYFFDTHPTGICDLVRRADREDVDRDDLTKLQKMIKNCNACQRLRIAANRFRATIPNPNLVSHRDVRLDIMKWDGRTVNHAVDEDTNFSAPPFLPDEYVKITWDTFFKMWSSLYAGH